MGVAVLAGVSVNAGAGVSVRCSITTGVGFTAAPDEASEAAVEVRSIWGSAFRGEDMSVEVVEAL